jgi:hypothetical protein
LENHFREAEDHATLILMLLYKKKYGTETQRVTSIFRGEKGNQLRPKNGGPCPYGAAKPLPAAATTNYMS